MGGRIARHARHIIFQLAEVAVSREVFALILDRINDCGPYLSNRSQRSPPRTKW